jgi:hypothetical protein
MQLGYHKFGRTKKPWNCEHEKLYAHGLCQNCYINKYNQVYFKYIFLRNVEKVFFHHLQKMKMRKILKNNYQMRLI